MTLPAPRVHRHAPRNFARTPLNVYWEMTQACALACRHCRAEAVPQPHPRQLTHQESLAFLEQILAFGDPLPQLILTGGDPLSRPDLLEIVDAARALGIPVSITPSATPNLTRELLGRLKERGVEALGLSLDGSTPALHDAIRGISGTFERTLETSRWAAELGMPLQVNTLVAAETAADLPNVYALLRTLAVARWSLFFLIAVGRGRVLQPLEPREAERLMGWISDVQRSAPFVVATTEAPSFRRVAIGRMRAAGLSGEEIGRSAVGRGFGVRDGNGIVFVSSTGDICPAGFLPLAAGNVRTDHIVEVYRESELFGALHRPELFGGRCGRCEYRALCGGSRARAYAASGDPLGEDPLCPYEPGRN
jgi:AdoMet-dependent heme synthase